MQSAKRASISTKLVAALLLLGVAGLGVSMSLSDGDRSATASVSKGCKKKKKNNSSASAARSAKKAPAKKKACRKKRRRRATEPGSDSASEQQPYEPGRESTSDGVATDVSTAACPSGSTRVLSTVQPSQIDEASGMALSSANPGVIWLHNDSGDSARIFALNFEGRLLATVELGGAEAWDWEAMAIGPGPQVGRDYLYLGDIGDNDELRDHVTIYRVPEPQVSPQQSAQSSTLSGVERQDIRYPDAANDAETLMVDPLSGDIYVVSKRDPRSRIYRLSSQPFTGSVRTLELVGELAWGWAVAGDISRTGSDIVVKGYTGISYYHRPLGTSVAAVLSSAGTALPYTIEPQGESIALCPNSDGYLTISEGVNQPIYFYRR